MAQTLNDLIRQMQVGDRKPLNEPRIELSCALFALGCLGASGAAGLFDGRPVPMVARQQIASAIYDLTRVAVSIGMDLDAAIATEIANRNRDLARLDLHSGRVGDAFAAATLGGSS